MLILARLYAMSNLAKKPMLAQKQKLNQDLCEGISGSSINWYFAREYCTECMSKKGPNIINTFCQLS